MKISISARTTPSCQPSRATRSKVTAAEYCSATRVTCPATGITWSATAECCPATRITWATWFTAGVQLCREPVRDSGETGARRGEISMFGSPAEFWCPSYATESTTGGVQQPVRPTKVGWTKQKAAKPMWTLTSTHSFVKTELRKYFHCHSSSFADSRRADGR